MMFMFNHGQSFFFYSNATQNLCLNTHKWLLAIVIIIFFVLSVDKTQIFII